MHVKHGGLLRTKMGSYYKLETRQRRHAGDGALSMMAFATFVLCPLMILCFPTASSVTLSTSNTTPKPHPCDKLPNDGGKSKLETLADSFDESSTRRDIVFILDRSASIHEDIFKQQKKLVLMVTDFLSSKGNTVLSYNHTRVALISFGAQSTIEVDGIGNKKKHVNSCVFPRYVNELKFSSGDGGSRIADAIRDASTLLRKGREGPEKHKQVVWIFFDGEEVEYDKITHDGKNAKGWYDALKNDGVEFFAVGVGGRGGYLDTKKRLEKVKSLANDESHFACVETWINSFTNHANSISTTSKRGNPRYVKAGQVDECPNCTGVNVCLCDTNNVTYTCGPPPVDIPKEPECATGDDCTSGLSVWIIVVIIVSVTLIIVVIIIAVCLKVRSLKLPRHPGPPLPTPPILPRLTNRPPVRRRPPYGNVTEDPIYDNADPYDETTYDTSSYGYIDIPYPEDVSKDEQHENMIGWPDTLYSMSVHRSTGLSHLCIYSTKSRQWATTPRFKLSLREVKELGRFFRHTENNKNHLQLHGERYMIDKDWAQSQLMVRVTRKKGPSDGTVEVAYVLKVEDFVIVGVSNEDKESKCHDVVVGLKSYVQDKLIDDYESPLYSSDYSIYGGQAAPTLPHAPHRTVESQAAPNLPHAPHRTVESQTAPSLPHAAHRVRMGSNSSNPSSNIPTPPSSSNSSRPHLMHSTSLPSSSVDPSALSFKQKQAIANTSRYGSTILGPESRQ